MRKRKENMTMKINSKLPIFLILLSNCLFANDNILKEFESQAKSADPKFITFNISSGEKIFRAERVHSKGDKISCMTCHTPDPKKTGLTRANKVIEPIAPIANPERFTDMIKVNKWFKRNCNDVLERECTIKEKGDFIVYMMSIK